MFLNKLSTSEKQSFLSLAMHAAEANGVVEAKETALIEEYCKEMNVPSFDGSSVLSFEDAVCVFQASFSEIRRIVVLEIIGLMYADGSYDDEEKAFVQMLAQAIGVSEDSVKKLDALADQYRELVGDIVEEVFSQN